jgi:hypothetical protein
MFRESPAGEITQLVARRAVRAAAPVWNTRCPCHGQGSIGRNNPNTEDGRGFDRVVTGMVTTPCRRTRPRQSNEVMHTQSIQIISSRFTALVDGISAAAGGEPSPYLVRIRSHDEVVHGQSLVLSAEETGAALIVSAAGRHSI